MDVVSVNPGQPEPSAIEAAVEVLRRGGILAYPTDTCYGLGGDARNPRALERISLLKGRDAAKKYSVILPSIARIEDCTLVAPWQRRILERYLPGPFTFILLNADFAVAQTSTLGVRIPDYAVTQRLADAFGEPYITSSANQAGQGALYSLEDIQRELLEPSDPATWPDLILDAGPLPRVMQSTVVDIVQHPPRVIRQGAGQLDAAQQVE